MNGLQQMEVIFNQLLTPREYADKYKISLRTVYDWIKKGKLKLIKIKGKNLIDTR